MSISQLIIITFINTLCKRPKLIKSCLFFILLFVASAVNTVIECIVRNTPLIINRLPALEEVLGRRYPGFYNIEDQLSAANMIQDINQIKIIYNYLVNLDKTNFLLQNVLIDLQRKIKNIL